MAPDQTAPVPAGWYPDPYGTSELRWWDGQNWTDSVHPPVSTSPVQTPEPHSAVTEPTTSEPVPVEPADPVLVTAPHEVGVERDLLATLQKRSLEVVIPAQALPLDQILH